MGLTSFRDERENFVALIQKPNISHLVTKLITTQELLKMEQAHWNWNYNRATARCAQGEKLSKQVCPTKSGMGRDGTRDSRKFAQKPTLKVPILRPMAYSPKELIGFFFPHHWLGSGMHGPLSLYLLAFT